MIRENIDKLSHEVIVTCKDGTIVNGFWCDFFDVEDANEDEIQEDSIGIDTENESLEIMESEIESIQLAE